MPEIQFLTFTEFNAMIRTGVAVIDFSAPWCSPCRIQHEVMARLEKAYNGRVLFLALNLDNSAEIALHLTIQSVPSILIFKKGIEIRRFVGLQPEKPLRNAIDGALHLNG